MELGAGECSVWWAQRGMLRARHVDLLDPVEQRRRLEYRCAADRERFSIGAAVLRLAAARVLGADPARLDVDRQCRSCGRPHGRPRVAGTSLQLSISHSEDQVAVAVSAAAPIGVDVERVTDLDTEDVVHRVLGPGEVLSRPRDFFVYWTRKESVVKATGAGLRTRLSEVIVSRPSSPARLLSCPGMSAADACLRDLQPASGYVAALTILGSAMPSIRQRDAATLLGVGSRRGSGPGT